LGLGRTSCVRPPAPAPSALASGPHAAAANDTLTLPIAGARLGIKFCAPNIVRVAYARDPAFFTRPTIATAPKQCPGAAWTKSTLPNETVFTTDQLKVHVDAATGAVSFHDAADHPILSEAPGGRTLVQARVHGEETAHVGQQWLPNDDESLYGLGQHQQGL